MPKEIIYSRSANDFNTKVAWDDDGGYVQVGTIHDDTADLVRGILADPNEVALFDGFHATLTDRRSVNALIRALKHARDAAFGRDE